MSRAQFTRSGILTPEERGTAARKCLLILDQDADFDGMTQKSRDFAQQQLQICERPGYTVSEPQLAWLRDLVEKHAT